MQRIVSLLVGLAALGLVTPLHAQVFDHLQCHKIKDPSERARYTADITPSDPAFPAQPGCLIKVPAKLFCTDVRKANVMPAPPGAAPGPLASRYLCYKTKCPKTRVSVAVTDQFGARDVAVKAPSLVCAPLSGSMPTTTSTTSTTTTTLPPAGCPVVNEIMTGSTASASAEFIEVLNPCAQAVDLSGAKLAYRSAAGTSDNTLFTWPAGSVIAAGAHLVYGSPAFTGAKDGEFAAGLAGTGGGVGIRDASGLLVDAVGYGTATNAFVEMAPAPAPAAGSSIGRFPDGTDSDDNATDWVESGTTTPGAPNLTN